MNLKEQPEWLWAIVIFSTAFFILSATLLYMSRQQILNIVQKHYAGSLEQLALLTYRLPDPRVRLASSLFIDYGFGGLATGCSARHLDRGQLQRPRSLLSSVAWAPPSSSSASTSR